MSNNMAGGWIGLTLLAACSGLLASAAPHPVHSEQAAAQPAECECASEVEALEVQLAECAEAAPPPPEPQRVKAITRTIEVPGPPKKCAAAAPDIKPVRSTTCLDGFLCLDDKNQANLLHNELAYRSWISQAQACERGE